jgi:hypothetical protein
MTKGRGNTQLQPTKCLDFLACREMEGKNAHTYKLVCPSKPTLKPDSMMEKLPTKYTVAMLATKRSSLIKAPLKCSNPFLRNNKRGVVCCTDEIE